MGIKFPSILLTAPKIKYTVTFRPPGGGGVMAHWPIRDLTAQCAMV
jgi:hypothetical protein